jgi:hypothetical protein
VLDPTGGLVAQAEIPSSQQGYEQLLHFAGERAPGRRCWALEGTGCYGAGLASFLTDQGEWVTEIDRPKRTGRTPGQERRPGRDPGRPGGAQPRPTGLPTPARPAGGAAGAAGHQGRRHQGRTGIMAADPRR